MIVCPGYAENDRARPVRCDVLLHKLPELAEDDVLRAGGITQVYVMFGAESYAGRQYQLQHFFG